ncbi:MAG: MBL fold metallo-hydrolase [Gemmatimonadetes bacterium]|nr:MBL fold metallo-hydrolase [Gemmatimonadota bacterium]
MRQPPDSVHIIVVYDNNQYAPTLRTGWGLAVLVVSHGSVALFDTGADGPTLLANMRALSIDPRLIDAVVLSHAHSDHTGGLDGLLDTGIRPTVYLLPSFPEDFKRHLRSRVPVVETEGGQEVLAGVSTTGDLDGGIREQALVVETARGLVVVTGCAHPGVARMVARVVSRRTEPVHLVLGGFHLRDATPDQIQAIITEFRRLGVERVAPCHCTGDRAIEMFAAEYGEDFLRAGVGTTIVVGAVPSGAR